MSSAELIPVRLLELPIPVWERAQEQSEALLREFALIAAERADDSPHHALPARLLQVVDALTANYSGLTGTQESRLWEAVHNGEQVMAELDYEVPAEVAPAATALGRMLDEADDYCRQGEHLLTMAADETLVRFRWWFLDQFVDQIDGAAPVAWPQYRR